MNIDTKLKFVDLYKRGVLGNASPTWDNLPDFWACDPLKNYPKSQKFHLRNRVVGGPTFYNLTAEEIITLVVEIQIPGGEDSYYVSAMAPHHLGTLQGEVRLSPDFYDLSYTFTKKPMREAFADDLQTAQGIIASSLLRTYMNPVSYDWLQILLEEYPGHIVEFSCFSKCWGTLSQYNTVFWEVRNY